MCGGQARHIAVHAASAVMLVSLAARATIRTVRHRVLALASSTRLGGSGLGVRGHHFVVVPGCLKALNSVHNAGLVGLIGAGDPPDGFEKAVDGWQELFGERRSEAYELRHRQRCCGVCDPPRCGHDVDRNENPGPFAGGAEPIDHACQVQQFAGPMGTECALCLVQPVNKVDVSPHPDITEAWRFATSDSRGPHGVIVTGKRIGENYLARQWLRNPERCQAFGQRPRRRGPARNVSVGRGDGELAHCRYFLTESTWPLQGGPQMPRCSSWASCSAAAIWG